MSTATTEPLEDEFYSPAAHYFVSFSGSDGYDIINTGNEGPVLIVASGKSQERLSLPATMSFSPRVIDFFLPGTSVMNGRTMSEGGSDKSFGISFTSGLAIVITHSLHAFKPIAPMKNIYDSAMYPDTPLVEDEKGNFYVLSGKKAYAISSTDIKRNGLDLDQIRDLHYDPDYSFESNFMVTSIDLPVTQIRKEMFARFATDIARKI